MIHILDQIAKDNREREERITKKVVRNGSHVKGYYRNGVWINEHDRCDHLKKTRRK